MRRASSSCAVGESAGLGERGGGLGRGAAARARRPGRRPGPGFGWKQGRGGKKKKEEKKKEKIWPGQIQIFSKFHQGIRKSPIIKVVPNLIPYNFHFSQKFI